MSRSLLVVGATSGIGRAVADRFARDGFDLVLAGRDVDEVRRIASDLEIRRRIRTAVDRFEALDTDDHGSFWVRCREKARSLGSHEAHGSSPCIDGVVFCVGYLGTQERAQEEIDEVRRIVDVNFTACASFLTHVANTFERRAIPEPQDPEPADEPLPDVHGTESATEQASHDDNDGQGDTSSNDAVGQSQAWGERTPDWNGPLPFICVVSSVAGDRGRQSNYVYGSTKGGVNRFLQGLRQRLAGCGVQVITIKPGPVDTAMTWGKEMPLTASPERVARDIHRACRKGRNVVYTPWFWWPIMRIVQHIPEPIFKRLGI